MQPAAISWAGVTDWLIEMTAVSGFWGYDIIGDVHGCAACLKRLLHKLDYCESPAGFVYADSSRPRQVIFVGDLIDRGDEIPETLAIARQMWEHGNAQIVMGNHEFNAIAFHTMHNGDFLREHSERNKKQIEATLSQFSQQQQELVGYLEWFKELPLFLEFENFRIVHACWDEKLISEYWRYYQSNKLVDEILYGVREEDSFAHRFVDRLTRGLQLRLPEGYHVLGSDGLSRRNFRVQFWSDEAETYEDLVFQPDPLPEPVRDRALTEKERKHLLFYGAEQKPLFTGHYWLQGNPQLVSPNIACLDYSAVNQGKLVAYRLQHNDTHLDNRRFVYVDCKGTI